MPPIIWNLTDAEAEDIAWAIAAAGERSGMTAGDRRCTPAIREAADQCRQRMIALARSLDAAASKSLPSRRRRPTLAPPPE